METMTRFPLPDFCANKRAMIPRPFFLETDPDLRKIGWWLLIVAAMVFAMILVGGATRLTESGLSIVEWKPISGTIPPLSDEAWEAEFAAYKAYPEYQKLNRGMTIEDFKGIYWWEFWHRNLGRLIGLAFALPLLFFIGKQMIPPDLKMRMFVLLALGAGQGLLGWFMVQSGLVDRPSVSHYRLAAHLAMAVLVLSALLWTAWQVLGARRFDEKEARVYHPFMRGFLALVALQLVYGAFVAGLDAGLIYNDFPLMNGKVFPDGMWDMVPFTANFFDNHGTVQFIHRTFAYLIFLLAWIQLYKAYRLGASKCLKDLSKILAGVVTVQFFLGVTTLLTGVEPILGVMHQGMGIVLFATGLYFVYATGNRGHG